MQTSLLDYQPPAVYRWPCTGPGTQTRPYTGAIGGHWRALPRPVLSGWVTEPTDDGVRLRRYWLHPRPLSLRDNEVRRAVAVSINPDTLKYSVRFVPDLNCPKRFGRLAFHQAESLEGAQEHAEALLAAAGWVVAK